MKIITLLALPILLLLIAGCGTTVGLSAKSTHSGFDNARVVTIVPHRTMAAGAWDTEYTTLGAKWNEARKDRVVLIVAVTRVQLVSVKEYATITGAELSVDGEKIELQPTDEVTEKIPMQEGEATKTSTRSFATSLDTVEKILKSKRTWLRVHTTGAEDLDNGIIDGAKDSKAYHALERFMKAVKGT